MKALSLTPPWAWIILHLGKRIENRTWDTPYRGQLLLHSSKTMTKNNWYEAHDFVERFDPEGATRIPKPGDPRIVRGAIVGFAVLSDVILPGGYASNKICPRASATRQKHRALESHQRVWYMGEFGFCLKEVRETRVVPCSGLLGLWTPSETLIRAALGEEKHDEHRMDR